MIHFHEYIDHTMLSFPSITDKHVCIYHHLSSFNDISVATIRWSKSIKTYILIQNFEITCRNMFYPVGVISQQEAMLSISTLIISI